MNTAVVNVMGMVSVYVTNAGDATVADVKKWLNKIEELGIPEETRLDSASLKLTYRAPVVSKLECGDCAPHDSHLGFSVFETDCSRDEKKDQ